MNACYWPQISKKNFHKVFALEINIKALKKWKILVMRSLNIVGKIVELLT